MIYIFAIWQLILFLKRPEKSNMPVIVGTLLVGTGLVGAAAAASTVGGALYYKYRKMERRKLSKNATSGLFIYF